MRCPYCKEIVTKNLTLKELFLSTPISQSSLCLRCLSTFKRLPDTNICYGCHRPSSKKYCPDCIKWQMKYPEYDFHHEALYEYNTSMHEWFEQYKFRGDLQLSTSFRMELQRYFKNKKDVVVVPLPVTQQRLEKRGFNQVEELLKAADICYSNLLVRQQENQPQSQKTRKERLKLTQPFALTAKAEEQLQNQIVYLVDDIYTTGRTLFHAAQALSGVSVKKLYTFSLAR